MCVDNFKDIEEMLDFRLGKNKDQVCYQIKLIKRRKDKGNEEMETGSKTIKTMIVCNMNQFRLCKEEIIRECNFHNCRAYISVNPKSQVSVAKTYAKTLLDMLLDGNKEFHFNRLLESTIDRVGSCAALIEGTETLTQSRTKWIIDIDTKDPLDVLEIENYVLSQLKNIYGNDLGLLTKLIPTHNGYHLITPPFNSEEWKNKFPEVAIHKNNDTLLYFNSL